MAVEPMKVKVTSESEIAQLLQAASDRPLLLELDGILYRVQREGAEDHRASYDPEEVRAALREVAGSWADLDAATLIADLYRAREEGSRPASRP